METLTVTVEGAKQALGVGSTTIYELMNSGKLQTVKIGRRRLVKADSIRALVGQAA